MCRLSFWKWVRKGSISKLATTKKSPLCRTLAAVVAASLLSAFAAPSRAAIFSYAPPPLIGNQVTYPSVSESSSTSSTPLYGAPTVSGNNLVFSNLNFSAISTNASPALDFVDGQLNFTLQSDPGSFLQTLDLTEFGDYNVSATPANPAAVNFAEAYENDVQITVLAVNGVALNTPLVNNTSDMMMISPDGGQYETDVTPSTGNFTGTADANLAALFGSNQITEIAVSFDNQLLAESQLGGIADIAKKGFDVVPGTGPNVPEPSSASLVLFAVGMGLKRRRNRRAENSGSSES
jgi:hypothetical protein